MSAREWKPGDVATFGGLPALRTTKGWAHYDGSVGGLRQDHYNLRPLVVIDPEPASDSGDISRLCALIGKHHGERGAVDLGLDWYAMQAALREFADPKPPKPDEPTGLAAVVEDAAGDKWVWLAQGAEGAHWYRVGIPERRATWALIDAVRVLSEGVTA